MINLLFKLIISAVFSAAIPSMPMAVDDISHGRELDISKTNYTFEIIVPLAAALSNGEASILTKWLSSDVLADLKDKVGDALVSQSVKSVGAIVGFSAANRSDMGIIISLTATTVHDRGDIDWNILIDKSKKQIVSLNFTAGKKINLEPLWETSGSAVTSSGPATQAGLPPQALPFEVPPTGGAGPSASPNIPGNPFGRTLERNGGEFCCYEVGSGGGGGGGGGGRRGALVGGLENTINRPIEKPDPPANQMQIMFATTRRPNIVNNKISFTVDRSDSLAFGIARVGIPINHKIGSVERPASWSFFGFNFNPGPEDDKAHFTVKAVQLTSRDQMISLLQTITPDEALIFVHGYNNTFDASLYRTAQIAWDLQYKGVPIMFSWPSKGTVTGYFYDRDSAYGSRAAFIDFLKMLRTDVGIKKVNILAHSMGNLLVLDALSNYAQTANPVQISNLIMAAPDVDRDQFVQFIPEISKITSGLTLYASSTDKALVTSKAITQAPRAGDLVLGMPVTLPGLESIDVSILGDEMLGLNHNVFATNKSILGDIKLLLNGALPPRVIDIRGSPEGIKPPAYWRYVP